MTKKPIPPDIKTPPLKYYDEPIENGCSCKLWAITMVSIMITAMIYILVESIK